MKMNENQVSRLKNETTDVALRDEFTVKEGERATEYLRRIREALVRKFPKADPTPETLR